MDDVTPERAIRQFSPDDRAEIAALLNGIVEQAKRQEQVEPGHASPFEPT